MRWVRDLQPVIRYNKLLMSNMHLCLTLSIRLFHNSLIFVWVWRYAKMCVRATGNVLALL